MAREIEFVRRDFLTIRRILCYIIRFLMSTHSYTLIDLHRGLFSWFSVCWGILSPSLTPRTESWAQSKESVLTLSLDFSRDPSSDPERSEGRATSPLISPSAYGPDLSTSPQGHPELSKKYSPNDLHWGLSPNVSNFFIKYVIRLTII